jgi:hypothetical protein
MARLLSDRIWNFALSQVLHMLVYVLAGHPLTI